MPPEKADNYSMCTRNSRFAARFAAPLAAPLAAIILMVTPLLPAQTETSAADSAAASAVAGTGQAELPASYRGLSLGMELEALKEALQQDALFNFRGDRDVSLLPAREQSLLETTGFSFIKRAFFQLKDGQLFIMAFNLNTEPCGSLFGVHLVCEEVRGAGNVQPPGGGVGKRRGKGFP